VEVLKQGQYEPMPVEKQVMQLYAATNREDSGKRGWIRNVPVADVVRWMREYIEFADSRYPQIAKDIQSKQALSDDIKAALNKCITEFNDLFQPTAGAKV
jgi:F-type H+/Na+-transporting ATPase subunit alpha